MLKRPHSEDYDNDSEHTHPPEKYARVKGEFGVKLEYGEHKGEAVDEEDYKDDMKLSQRGRSVPQKGGRPGKEGTVLLKYSDSQPMMELKKLIQANEPQVVEVQIDPKHMSTQNKQVRARQLWGNGIYTWDSDLVAVLVHLGYWGLPSAPQQVVEVRAYIVPMPPQSHYASFSRNSIRSRAWGPLDKEGCSYKVDRVVAILKGIPPNGPTRLNLTASPDSVASVVPTWTPAHFERALNTRAAASNLERRQRTLQEVTLQYNLCNEPWLKFSMAAIVDRGLKASQWTSSRFHKEVLFLENNKERYEIARVEPLLDEPISDRGEVYRLSKCTSVLPLARMWNVGVPLPEVYLQVLHPTLFWEDLQWSATGLSVKGRTLPVMRVHWTDRKHVPAEGAADTSGRPLA